MANMWLAQAEMVEEHESSFTVRHPDSLKKRVHRKRFHRFKPYSTLSTLESVTDANRDGIWSPQELSDALHYIHVHHDAMGRSTIQHHINMFRVLDLDRDHKLSKPEVVKTKVVDDIEFFLEQEALREVIHEMEERDGFAINPHQYRDREL